MVDTSSGGYEGEPGLGSVRGGAHKMTRTNGNVGHPQRRLEVASSEVRWPVLLTGGKHDRVDARESCDRLGGLGSSARAPTETRRSSILRHRPGRAVTRPVDLLGQRGVQRPVELAAVSTTYPHVRARPAVEAPGLGTVHSTYSHDIGRHSALRARALLPGSRCERALYRVVPARGGTRGAVCAHLIWPHLAGS